MADGRSCDEAEEPLGLAPPLFPFARAALIVIDMQNDFADPGGAMYVEGSDRVVTNIGRLLQHWRRMGLPIFHVVRLYRRDLSNAEPSRRNRLAEIGGAVVPGTHGAAIVPSLLPDRAEPASAEELMAGELVSLGPREWCLYKPRWGAFYRTGLQDRLIELGIDSVVLCGCNLPNCPRATAFEASERDFRVILVSDATSQTTTQRLEDLALIGVELTTTLAISAPAGGKRSAAPSPA